MQDCICVLTSYLQQFESLGGRQDTQLNLTTPGFLLNFVHHRQSTRTRTDHQAATLPRDPLFNGERSVTKIIAESLGGLLFPFVNFSAVNDYVMVVCNAINSDGSEGKRFAYAPPPNASVGRLTPQLTLIPMVGAIGEHARRLASGSRHSPFAMSSEPRRPFPSAEPIKTQCQPIASGLRTSIWPFRTRTSRHGCGCTAGPSSTRPSSSANREA